MGVTIGAGNIIPLVLKERLHRFRDLQIIMGHELPVAALRLTVLENSRIIGGLQMIEDLQDLIRSAGCDGIDIVSLTRSMDAVGVQILRPNPEAASDVKGNIQIITARADVLHGDGALLHNRRSRIELGVLIKGIQIQPVEQVLVLRQCLGVQRLPAIFFKNRTGEAPQIHHLGIIHGHHQGGLRLAVGLLIVGEITLRQSRVFGFVF